jgi:hypothetical protein
MGSPTVLGMVILAAVTATPSDPCKRASARYEGAKAEVIETVRAYQQCIAESLGRDDCGEEFADLDLAQARHERAVADYHNYCR